ncbi:MAG: exosome complex RNA-binding protein Csl4 [Candidatus Altiarchaeota archaeon]|nr:exosome complex RNA-binding protein Csl4 [Candidatus Altiarchaeota archaeon]
MENKTALIGDYLGTIEEFVPGKGTYAEEGRIYASTMGKVVIDNESHTVNVEGKFPPVLDKGMVVFGEILDIRKNAAVVIIRRIMGYEGEVDIKAGLFVSNIADGYVEKPEDVLAIGDIVKGVVIRIEAGLIDISTKGDMGLVKAFCRRCRCPLEKSQKNDGLMLCPCCGNKEKRKTAPDYGNVAEM